MKKLNPNDHPDVEGVRNTATGKRDLWRKESRVGRDLGRWRARFRIEVRCTLATSFDWLRWNITADAQGNRIGNKKRASSGNCEWSVTRNQGRFRRLAT